MIHGGHGAHSEKLDENRFAPGVDSSRFVALMILAVPPCSLRLKPFAPHAHT